MKIVILHILILIFTSFSFGQINQPKAEKLNHTHPIKISPENYICYKTKTPLNIDGHPNEIEWGKTPWTKPFVDIEGDLKPKPPLKTQVKMLWDEKYFYFFAKLEEPHVWAKLKERDAVIYYDDDFEIFIDPDGDSHNYYEFEVNAFNTLWELLLLRPYGADKSRKVLNNWNIPNVKSAIHIEGTINDPSDVDKYWTVEMAIPWSALMELAPKRKEGIPFSGEQWRVNFSRVDWSMNIKKGIYFKAKNKSTGKKIPENNWVWSPTGFINMHRPEQWGYVQFSNKKIGEGKEKFIHHSDEWIKQALWNLYFQQRKYFKKNKSYSDDLNHFTIPKITNVDCDFAPQIFTTPHLFEIIAKSCEKNGNWSIRQDGKIDFFPKK